MKISSSPAIKEEYSWINFLEISVKATGFCGRNYIVT